MGRGPIFHLDFRVEFSLQLAVFLANIAAFSVMLHTRLLKTTAVWCSGVLSNSAVSHLFCFQNLGLGNSDSDSFITASQPENKTKNRYAILPCELKLGEKFQCTVASNCYRLKVLSQGQKASIGERKYDFPTLQVTRTFSRLALISCFVCIWRIRYEELCIDDCVILRIPQDSWLFKIVCERDQLERNILLNLWLYFCVVQLIEQEWLCGLIREWSVQITSTPAS